MLNGVLRQPPPRLLSPPPIASPPPPRGAGRLAVHLPVVRPCNETSARRSSTPAGPPLSTSPLHLLYPPTRFDDVFLHPPPCLPSAPPTTRIWRETGWLEGRIAGIARAAGVARGRLLSSTSGGGISRGKMASGGFLRTLQVALKAVFLPVQAGKKTVRVAPTMLMMLPAGTPRFPATWRRHLHAVPTGRVRECVEREAALPGYWISLVRAKINQREICTVLSRWSSGRWLPSPAPCSGPRRRPASTEAEMRTPHKRQLVVSRDSEEREHGV